MAPVMVVKLPVEVADQDQLQVSLVMPPSGSLRVAVRGSPTTGVGWDRLTVPASLTLVTVMVTSISSVPPEGSVAVIVAEYEGLASWSMVASDFTVISPLGVSRLKSWLKSVSSVPPSE